jgi:hypothetical protein
MTFAGIQECLAMFHGIIESRIQRLAPGPGYRLAFPSKFTHGYIQSMTG